MNLYCVTPAKVFKVINEDIKSRKSPGYNLITGEILKQLTIKNIR